MRNIVLKAKAFLGWDPSDVESVIDRGYGEEHAEFRILVEYDQAPKLLLQLATFLARKGEGGLLVIRTRGTVRLTVEDVAAMARNLQGYRLVKVSKPKP